MTQSSQTAPRAASRRQFWLLIAVFFAPLLVAFVLYYGASGWRPAGGTHHGDLIDPARPLPQVSLQAPDKSPLAANLLRGKWSLVYIGAGACDVRCREALVLMRQVRLALNDDLTRVARVFLVTAECCDQAYLNEQHEGLVVARLDSDAAGPLLDAFPQYSGVSVGEAGRIYVVDPLGNLMMSYAPDAPPKGLLEDLKKLLKLSRIG